MELRFHLNMSTCTRLFLLFQGLSRLATIDEGSNRVDEWRSKEQRSLGETIPNKPQKKLRVLYLLCFSPNRIVFCFLHKFWCCKCDTFILVIPSEKPNRNQPSWFRESKPPLSHVSTTASTWAGERIIYHKSLSDRYLAGTQHPRLCNQVQYGKILRWNLDFVT